MCAALAPSATAQIATALVRTTDPLPGGSGQTINLIGGVACNQAGGYALRVNTGGAPVA